VIVALAVSSALAVSAAPQPVRFYVATNGNDQWSGSRADPNARRTDGPFATLERAREAVRDRRRGGGSVRVLVRGGAYRLAKPFVLRPEDSGMEQCPITYAAYPKEQPILSGGRPITGWKRGDGELWVAEVPGVKEGKWNFRQLFVNGQRRRRPRLPRKGQYAIVGPVVAEKWDDPQNRQAFRYKEGDLRTDWRSLDDVEVVVLQHWMEARLRIAKLDDAANTVTFTGGSWRPLTWSTGYVVENVREALDEPGEWYLDRKAGTLTYWPLPGEDMAKAPVVAPVLEQLVRLEGDPEGGKFVEHIALRGLTFSHATAPLPEAGYGYPQAEIPVAAAVYAEGARHCAFEELELAHVGQWGVELSRGCQDHRLVGNRIYDVGCGGLKIGEPTNPERDADEACRTLVTDNRVYDGNAVYMGAPAIWIGQSGSNVVAHNEIHGAWEWGISVGWTWEYVPPNRARDNRIEYNCIHDLGASELGTHAAIYCLGLSPGTVVRNNHLHHVSASGYGIILDQGCCGVLVENNLVHDTDGGFCSNFHCIGNVILNNIFALTRKSQMHRYGDNPPGGFELANTNIYCRNLGYWKEGKLFSRDEWLDFATVQDFNLYWNASGEPVTFMKYSLAEWRAKGLDRSSVIADPLFVDPDNGDFTLKPESPAFKLGFRPLDVSGAGPRE